MQQCYNMIHAAYACSETAIRLRQELSKLIGQCVIVRHTVHCDVEQLRLDERAHLLEDQAQLFLIERRSHPPAAPARTIEFTSGNPDD